MFSTFGSGVFNSLQSLSTTRSQPYYSTIGASAESVSAIGLKAPVERAISSRETRFRYDSTVGQPSNFPVPVVAGMSMPIPPSQKLANGVAGISYPSRENPARRGWRATLGWRARLAVEQKT